MKLKILGKRVFEYWNTSTGVGVEYTLGETRDLLVDADKVQRELLLGKYPTAQNTYMSVKGAAAYSDGNLTIREERFRHTSVDRVVGGKYLFKAGNAMFLSEKSITFAIDRSCSKCSISKFREQSGLIGGPIIIKIRLANSSCTID